MGGNMSLLPSADIQKPTLYIFGYGSLLWNPGFTHDYQRRAMLRGYSRRFYQGNTTYRGSEDLPGRVVTLVEDEKSHTYGLIFKVTGKRQVFDALEHLYEREIENGYTFQIVNVECVETGEVTQALTVIAFDQNAWYLGPPP